MIALIDSDILLYASGFSAQKTMYNIDEAHFDSKKDALDWCKDNEYSPDGLVSYVIAEDVSHALHNAKVRIEGVLKATDADEYICYLTGKGNYRDELVDYYKKNRKADKPVHYQAIKDYLIEQHDAIVVEGMEADDMLGIVQTQSRLHGVDTCIASIDKDLNTIEGLHYNWTKDSLYNVTEEEANKFLYTQMLTGDTVDNIKGVKGIGPKKAEKILAGATTELQLFRRVQGAYLMAAEKEHPEKSSRALFDVAMDSLMENAQLLFILKHPDERYTPPTEDI